MKKKLTVLGALLMAVVVTGYSVSGTYAKYTSTITGTSNSARVASWAIDITNGATKNADKSITFDLFDMNNLYELDKTTGEVSTTKESHILTTNGTIIAPGMGGYVDIEIKNSGEVNADVKGFLSAITFTGADIPLEFSNGNGIWVGKSGIKADIDATEAFATAKLAPEETTTMRIYWRWAFEKGADATEIEANDRTDTSLATVAEGKTASDLSAVTVTAKLTATQID